ncbi:MAG: PAS domain S-box protein [Bacteroidales bacterium]|nr:PAS domain S-box protein [Bacteroidales bacterium]
MKEEKNLPTNPTENFDQLIREAGLNSEVSEMLQTLAKSAYQEDGTIFRLEELLSEIKKDKKKPEHYFNLFRNAPSGYFTLDKEGKIGEINLCAAGMLGNALEGKLLTDYLDNSSIQKFEEFLESVFSYQGKSQCEVIINSTASQQLHLRIEGLAFSESSLCHAVIMDISEQKKVEHLLQNNEDWIQTLFELAVDAILIGNQDGIIIQANKSAAELSGYTQSQLLGKPIDILFNKEELNRIPFQYEKLKEGKIVRRERFLTRKDGTLLPVEMHTKMMPDKSYQTFIRDMAERKRIEDALRASEKKFSEAFMTSPDSININRTQDGVYIEINNGFTSVTGYTKEDVIGKSSLDPCLNIWTHPEDRKRMVELLKNNGEVAGFEAPFRMKDGTVRFGLMSARFIEINGEGCIISTTRDITDRKRSEESLIQSEQSFRGILNTVSESIYVLDENGKFIDINEGADKMYGYNREDILGKGIDFVSADGKNDLESIGRAVQKTLIDGTPLHFEFWGKRKNGDIFPKDVICNKGKYFGKDVIIATARDITDRKRNEDVLLTAKKKAEESERLKSAFLANMSHEIRSPMNSIVGFSELIEDEDLPAEQRHEFISIIRNSGKQLLTIINDIIDFAKIDSNQLTISPAEINLNRILDDIMLVAEVEKRNLHKDNVNLISEKGLPDDNCTLLCDEVRLKQILINLTGNALKFTNKGHIKTGYKLDNDNIIFFVEDTGKGIAKEKQEIIFERFRQEEESYTRLYGGTGLGLSISKGLVELLGGKMWLVSDLGVGATFYFSIPSNIWLGYSAKKETLQTTTIELDLSGKTILIAEDIESNFRLINHMLKKTNARILYAQDGSEAVDICKQEEQVDLILMDIQMPVMNGFEATAEIKKFLPSVPVITLTAFTLSNESEEILAAGCNDYLTKPIDKVVMLEKVKKYLLP